MVEPTKWGIYLRSICMQGLSESYIFKPVANDLVILNNRQTFYVRFLSPETCDGFDRIVTIVSPIEGFSSNYTTDECSDGCFVASNAFSICCPRALLCCPLPRDEQT